MKKVTVKLQSMTPYQQGGEVSEKKLQRETPDAYEERTWKGRAHIGADGKAFIPPMAFKKAIETASRFSGEQIPGKGKERYTKTFVSGVVCTYGPSLGITSDEISGEWRFVPSDGKAGGGRRVWKCFPTFKEWAGQAEFIIYDDQVTKEVFERHLKIAGILVGIGVWRREKGGLNGQFHPTEFLWEEMSIDSI